MSTAGSAFPSSPVLRAGLGELPQAALFGHSTTALAGWRDGTGKGRALFGGVKMSTRFGGSKVTVASTKKGPSEPGQEDTVFAQRFREEQTRYSSTTAKFFSEPQTENGKRIILEKVAGLAEKSIDLLLKVEAEFKTEEGCGLYKELWQIGMGFLVAAEGCRHGREPTGLVPNVAYNMEMLRRAAYSAIDSPLPPTAAEFVLLAYAANSSDDTGAIVDKLERLFKAVKADVEALLSI